MTFYTYYTYYIFGGLAVGPFIAALAIRKLRKTQSVSLAELLAVLFASMLAFSNIIVVAILVNWSFMNKIVIKQNE